MEEKNFDHLLVDKGKLQEQEQREIALFQSLPKKVPLGVIAQFLSESQMEREDFKKLENSYIHLFNRNQDVIRCSTGLDQLLKKLPTHYREMSYISD